jgi:hypothetical protein
VLSEVTDLEEGVGELLEIEGEALPVA